MHFMRFLLQFMRRAGCSRN